MNITNLNRPNSLAQPSATLRRWSLASAVGCGLLGLASLQAATVTTLSGGPLGLNQPAFGFADGDSLSEAQYHTPMGVALNTSETLLYVADRDNNAIRVLNFSLGETLTFATNQISQPVSVAVDTADNVYVLNRGNGANGSLRKFDKFGDLIGTFPGLGPLNNATGMALDSSGNVYLALNGNTLAQVVGTTNFSLVTKAVIPNAGTSLQGLIVLRDGWLAACDAGRHGVLKVNPVSGVVSNLTGFNGAGDHLGQKQFVQLNQPFGLTEAGAGVLVVSDRGNHRVKVVDPLGTVTNLYGVSSNFWVQGNPNQGIFPGWWDGVVSPIDIVGTVEARDPVGLVIAKDSSVYSTEDYYHLIRKVTGTGLPQPGSSGGGGGSGTNVVVAVPSITPNSGYFPMGQTITVNSGVADVFYTTDGSEPTTNGLRVPISGNTGTIQWNNSLADLTSLRLRAFLGTNASAVVSGQPASANTIGIPSGLQTVLHAGVGSKVMLPVVVNLRSNDLIKSFQFRVEVTPDGGAPMVSAQYEALNISTNDFVPVVTAAQGGAAASFVAQPYSYLSTRGLAISAIGTNSHVVITNFAVMGMLAIPIPGTAVPGQTYRIQVLEPSATSDGAQTPVPLTATPATTILVTNVFYTVGDASPGRWYNAGDFGNGNLDNTDVNTAFYASTGLRLPPAFSDVFDAMDTFPEDGTGFVGGDGQIRFLDWQVVLERSLRLNTNNWQRTWFANGERANRYTTLLLHAADAGPEPAALAPGAVWNRQATVGALSVGGAVPGGAVDVPVYVKLAGAATLGGMQFRAVVTPEDGAPAVVLPLQFTAASGLPSPSSQSFLANEIACGWSLGTLNFASRSSNYLGRLRVVMPTNALAGQSYTVHFYNADGAPNLQQQYDFESVAARFVLGAPASQPSENLPDEWKQFFFGNTSDPLAAPEADPDGDHLSNWQEYLAGTGPTNGFSRLQLESAALRTGANHQREFPLRWLTAPGKTYVVEFATSLQPGAAWTPLATVAGDGYVQEIIETNTTGEARFHRVRLVP